MRLTVLVCVLALTASQAQAASARWIGSWGASPAPPMTAPAPRATPTFDNQTVVQVLRLSAGGQRLRIRVSNEYGAKPLAIGAARVALLGADGAVLPGTQRVVSFSGRKEALIPAGAPMVSDPVALPTQALARLQVSLFLPSDTGGCTCHMSGLELVKVAPGDVTAGEVARTTGSAQYRAFLSGVEVESVAPPGPVIVAFGDSITDGYQSTVGTNHRWPDRLTERLVARDAGRPVGVVNAGIGGNRVLNDGAIAIFGQSALTRFDRDVLAVPGATHLVILEGVNDLGMTKPTPSEEALIAGYRQLIARARAHGVKVIGATILPFGGAAYFTPQGEAIRQGVNRWIRGGHEFDAVVDLDAAVRDPARPERMRAELQSGDWLHPNDAGYRAMGDAVDLSLFR